MDGPFGEGTTVMHLRRQLSGDELTIGALQNLYDSLCRQGDVIAPALACVEELEEQHAWRVLWLMRQATRHGASITAAEWRRLGDAIDLSRHWLWRLCACQLLAEVQIPDEAREAIFPFLCAAFEDRRVIVRTWSISALCQYADLPEYRALVRKYFAAAQRDSGKSMQARLRHIKMPPLRDSPRRKRVAKE
jgi:hypothetical protein